MKLYTASETRKIDNLAIKEKEISGYSLMQMAAEFSLDVILREFSPVEELIIFCSKGKNSVAGFLLRDHETLRKLLCPPQLLQNEQNIFLFDK